MSGQTTTDDSEIEAQASPSEQSTDTSGSDAKPTAPSKKKTEFNAIKQKGARALAGRPLSRRVSEGSKANRIRLGPDAVESNANAAMLIGVPAGFERKYTTPHGGDSSSKRHMRPSTSKQEKKKDGPPLTGVPAMFEQNAVGFRHWDIGEDPCSDKKLSLQMNEPCVVKKSATLIFNVSFTLNELRAAETLANKTILVSRIPKSSYTVFMTGSKAGNAQPPNHLIIGEVAVLSTSSTLPIQLIASLNFTSDKQVASSTGRVGDFVIPPNCTTCYGESGFLVSSLTKGAGSFVKKYAKFIGKKPDSITFTPTDKKETDFKVSGQVGIDLYKALKSSATADVSEPDTSASSSGSDEEPTEPVVGISTKKNMIDTLEMLGKHTHNLAENGLIMSLDFDIGRKMTSSDAQTVVGAAAEEIADIYAGTHSVAALSNYVNSTRHVVTAVVDVACLAK